MPRYKVKSSGSANHLYMFCEENEIIDQVKERFAELLEYGHNIRIDEVDEETTHHWSNDGLRRDSTSRKDVFIKHIGEVYKSGVY